MSLLAIGQVIRARSTIAVAVVSMMCAGCGTFQLASAVFPPAGRTQEQQQLDNLSCKDQAKLEANTTGRQAGAFALGLTVVGAPVAFEIEKAKQREVYKNCMEARGYRVLPPNDAPDGASPAASPPITPTVRPVMPAQPTASRPPASTTPTPTNVGTRDEAAQLQKLNELREKRLISEDEYEKKRKEILDRL